MHQLYSLSAALYEKVQTKVTDLLHWLDLPVELSEFITLPDYGQRVILRFDSITEEPVPQDGLDRTVTLMRRIAEPGYWVTLTDPHRRNSDLDMATLLQSIDEVLPSGMLVFPETPYTALIRADAKVIRQVLDLDSSYRIWEIESPVNNTEASPEIRILDTGDCGEGLSTRRETQTAMFNGSLCTVVFLKDNPSFQRCLKAYFAANTEQMTVMNYVTGVNTSK